MIDRRHKMLTAEEVAKIATTYHRWRNPDVAYEDVKGFCKAAKLAELRSMSMSDPRPLRRH